MVAVLSITQPKDKLFELQKMRYRGYLRAVLLTCCVGLFPTNSAPVAEHIVFFGSGLILILLSKNRYIQAAIIILFILSFVNHFGITNDVCNNRKSHNYSACSWLPSVSVDKRCHFHRTFVCNRDL